MTAKAIGSRVWAIAEGYIPGWSHGPEPQLESHETACLPKVSSKQYHELRQQLATGGSGWQPGHHH